MQKDAATGVIDMTPDDAECECGHTFGQHIFQLVECPGVEMCDGAISADPKDHGKHFAAPCNVCPCPDWIALDEADPGN